MTDTEEEEEITGTDMKGIETTIEEIETIMIAIVETTVEETIADADLTQVQVPMITSGEDVMTIEETETLATLLRKEETIARILADMIE